MLEETAASQDRYKRFLKRVTATGVVWTLDNGRGVVSTGSNGDDEERPVLLFWSECALAQRCAAEEWSAYRPKLIPLPAFKECWLPGMKRDGVLAGPEWNEHLLGVEVEPDTMLADFGGADGQ